MMAANLSEIRCISLPGLKKVWRITKGIDSVVCDDEVFVRVCRGNKTLEQLVLEKNPNISKDESTNNLACSVGIDTLERLRNTTQARMLDDEQPSSASLLFGGDSSQSQPKKKRRSRADIERARHERDSLYVTITVAGEEHDVRMLKPVNPRDNMFVAYEPGTLWCVIKFLREQGFSADAKKYRERMTGMPKGVYTRGDKFVIRYKKDDGTTGHKFVDNMDDAVTFLENPSAIHEDGDLDDGAVACDAEAADEAAASSTADAAAAGQGDSDKSSTSSDSSSTSPDSVVDTP
jgi:hypothetical protein